MLRKVAQKTTRHVCRSAIRLTHAINQQCIGRESTGNRSAFSTAISKTGKQKMPMKTHKHDKFQRRNKSGQKTKMIRDKSDKPFSHKDKEGDDKSTLSKCNLIMSKLLQRRQELPPPPIDWLYPLQKQTHVEDFERQYYLQARTHLYKDILSLIQVIELSIESKRIQASSGRDIRELTVLLGNVLLICSESPPKRFASDTLPSTSETCMKVLSLLNELNLDIQHFNNYCTIRAANQEYDWELASNLFRNQIDPDIHGLVPVDPRLGWDSFLEMGLYGLAMSLNERGYEGVDIVHGVLDAVRDMCLVSPTDQEKCKLVFKLVKSCNFACPLLSSATYIILIDVMAAGAALGRSGEWKAYIDVMSTSSEYGSEFGQSLSASMMNSCYICGKYDSVLELYYNMQDKSKSGEDDWQWEGKYASIHPLCTDLLLRSIGMRLQNTSEKYLGFSEGAIQTFHQIKENGGRISLGAIEGILLACKNDSDYEIALEILGILKVYGKQDEYIIVGESAENFLYDNEMLEEIPHSEVINEHILASVMDTCNEAGEYGLALLCIHQNNLSDLHNAHNDSKQMTMVGSLLQNQPSLYHHHRLLNSTIMALDGLNCSKDAYSLYHEVEKSHNNDRNEILRSPKRSNEMNITWREAFHHIDRLLYAVRSIDKTQHKVSPKEKYNLSLATALMLKYATEAGQVNAGIEVAKLVASCVNQNRSKKSMKDTVKSLFGLKEWNIEPDATFWNSSDELFSAIIAAHSIMYGSDDALGTFFALWESPDFKRALSDGHGISAWTETINISLELLVRKGNLDQAQTLFEQLKREYRTSDIYLTMASGFKQNARWNDVAACYLAAKEDGCLSEALCFLVMEGIAETSVNGKIKLLRSVADEIARKKGVKSGAWIFDNYWSLKRHLGFHYARLLMWWNDPNETQQQEFRIASQQLISSEKEKILPDFDALKTIINLAGYPDIVNKEDDVIVTPETLVYKALILIHETDKKEEDVSELLLKGMLYLHQTKSQTECVEYMKYIQSKDIILDDQIIFLARTTAGFKATS